MSNRIQWGWQEACGKHSNGGMLGDVAGLLQLKISA